MNTSASYRNFYADSRQLLFRGKRGAILSLLILLSVHLSHGQPVTPQQSAGDSLRSIAETDPFRRALMELTDSVQIVLDPDRLPENGRQILQSLNVRDMDLRDLMRGLGREYNLNLIVDNGINRRATVRLADLPVMEAIVHICREYGLQIRQSGRVFRIGEYRPPHVPEEPRIPQLSYAEDRLTMDLQDDDLNRVVRLLAQKTGRNIMVRNGVSGRLSGYLQKMPFENGFETMLKNNGYTLRMRDGVYMVDRGGRSVSGDENAAGPQFWVNVDGDYISMDVTDGKITDLIREIAYQTEVNMVTYSLPDGVITAKTHQLSLEQTLAYLFRGTSVTYRREDDIFIIGDKNTSGIATNRLIRLEHIRADVALELIPASITKSATVQLVKEQNGLMVIGTNDIILELENFINEIDFPTPQILIEALVVDLKSTDLYELGTTLGYKIKPDSLFNLGEFATFGTLSADDNPTGGLTLQGDGQTANSLFEVDGDLFGVKNLGVLPSDFYFRIQALSREGVMNIRSRPQIATLNGHTASIEIGTTQYFLLRSTTPLRSPQDVVVQESERFETIEANVSLEITPWVSASGEVTTEIHPEFNTPVGAFNAEVPPTINSRVLDSTVRLKDGETIILGGLIQDSDVQSVNKIPVLGDIPLLGKLFSNRRTNKVKSELVIFITPHVFYGDESDTDRWNQLKENMDIDTGK